jgi:NADH-quinone oxidoreductase subunit J
MTIENILFFVFATLAVAGAVSLILQRHPIHCALSLIVVMVSLAGLYLLLGADFVAAVQIIVYAGAIMVLFVFVIMLLNAGEEERTNLSRLARAAGLPLALALTAVLGVIVTKAVHLGTAKPLPPTPTRSLAMFLFKDYVFPFELTSFLILVAILGAVVLAQRER